MDRHTLSSRSKNRKKKIDRETVDSDLVIIYFFREMDHKEKFQRENVILFARFDELISRSERRQNEGEILQSHSHAVAKFRPNNDKIRRVAQ